MKKRIGDEEEVLREKGFETLSLALCEELHDQQKMILEPFDAYLQKVRFSFYSNPELFRTRFSRGYRALLDELEREISK